MQAPKHPNQQEVGVVRLEEEKEEDLEAISARSKRLSNDHTLHFLGDGSVVKTKKPRLDDDGSVDAAVGGQEEAEESRR